LPWRGRASLLYLGRMLERPRHDRPGNRFWTPSFCLNRNDRGADDMPNRAQQIYKQEFRFGLGGVSLGNEFNKHTDKEAEGTLEAAWEVGVRHFDVAPWYGFGLAERRFGHFLHNKKREDYLLSSKVGSCSRHRRTIGMRKSIRCPTLRTTSFSTTPRTACAARSRTACSASGVDQPGRRVRARHFPGLRLFPERLEEQYEIARKGAFPALSKMRDEGIIRAWASA